MSRFSGKCDFCDEIEIFGLDHILNSDVYVGDSKQPLRLAKSGVKPLASAMGI